MVIKGRVFRNKKQKKAVKRGRYGWALALPKYFSPDKNCQLAYRDQECCFISAVAARPAVLSNISQLEFRLLAKGNRKAHRLPTYKEA